MTDFDFIESLTPLGAVVLGAFVVHWSTTRMEKKRRTADARALAGMLAAEISVTIQNVERRGYEKFYRYYLKEFESGKFDLLPTIRGMHGKLPDIFAANIHRLGLLDHEVCCDVVSWYGSFQGIKYDLIELSAGKVLQEESAQLLRDVLEIWKVELEGKAPALIQTLKAV